MKQRIVWMAVGVMMTCSSLPVGPGAFCIAGERASGVRVPEAASRRADASGPVACVRTVPLKEGTISEDLTVYGSVIPAAGALSTVSIPFECQVVRVLVSEGQRVSKEEVLFEIRPSPDTMLHLRQAENAYELAQQSYRQVERRHELKLATNEQLLSARQILDQARRSLESMKDRGIGDQRKIDARVGGLVRRIYVQEGSIVPADNPILEMVAQDRMEVLLGVEPEDIQRVERGQAVSLARVNAPASPEVAGEVRKISSAVNPATRLVDVFVKLTSPAGFLLGEYVEGSIRVTVADGLIVPRAAVLPEGERYVVFTVRDGRAVKHTVAVGLENAEAYQIEGKDLRPGEKVVVLGNYELAHGMAVKTEGCE